MCEFCKKFDFGTATAKVDKYGASICFAGGFGRYPQEEQFKFCPVCGRRLDLYSRDGMTNEQAERLLLSHLMQVAFLMPIEWVEKKTETAVIFRKHMAWPWTLCGVEGVD